MAVLSRTINWLKGVWNFGKYLTIRILKKLLPEPVKKVVRVILSLRGRKIIAQNQDLLRQILQANQTGKNYRTIIIFPPSLDWDVQLFQRPQQLALALAKKGALVFYSQPKPDRKKPPFQLIEERLFLCNVHVDTFRILPSPWIYLLTWNSDYASCYNKPQVLYDFVDDINVFYGDQRRIAQGHQNLLQNSALVLATARKLFEEASLHRPDVILSPNGVVYEHFAPATHSEYVEPPEEIRPMLEKSKPIIGYYGALARWFDYQLLKDLARLRPEYEFVLIGPDYDGTLKHTDMLETPNIHWLGVVPYKELPRYLEFFDVATIPFIVNEITHATSPLKLFEYMAAEKPVVITPMRESMQYPCVLVGENANVFAEKIDLALHLRSDPSYLTQLRQTAIENTWEQRAEQILRAVEEKH